MSKPSSACRSFALFITILITTLLSSNAFVLGAPSPKTSWGSSISLLNGLSHVEARSTNMLDSLRSFGISLASTVLGETPPLPYDFSPPISSPKVCPITKFLCQNLMIDGQSFQTCSATENGGGAECEAFDASKPHVLKRRRDVEELPEGSILCDYDTVQGTLLANDATCAPSIDLVPASEHFLALRALGAPQGTGVGSNGLVARKRHANIVVLERRAAGNVTVPQNTTVVNSENSNNTFVNTDY